MSRKNAIFQYMITSGVVDDRGDIKGRNRSELYQECAAISKQSFEEYATIIGADHHYSSERIFTKEHGCSTSLLFECLRVIYDPIFDQYDKVLFVDTDIVVNTTDNIFDLCDDGADVYGVLESDIVTSNGGGYNSWDYKEKTFSEFVAKFNQHGAPILPTLPPSRTSKLTILNTGVVVWTREARLRARELFDPWVDWCYGKPAFHMSIMNDQPYISAMLGKYEFDLETISQNWNDSPHYNTEDEFFDKAKFCHYTGGDWKVDMVQHWKDRRYKTTT
tara:strand:- start:14091 stop:14918 length:828 start_codon:yes stop_codon:yes gene_type:complete